MVINFDCSPSLPSENEFLKITTETAIACAGWFLIEGAKAAGKEAGKALGKEIGLRAFANSSKEDAKECQQIAHIFQNKKDNNSEEDSNH